MRLFVLDTDILSLYFRDHPIVARPVEDGGDPAKHRQGKGWPS